MAHGVHSQRCDFLDVVRSGICRLCRGPHEQGAVHAPEVEIFGDQAGRTAQPLDSGLALVVLPSRCTWG